MSGWRSFSESPMPSASLSPIFSFRQAMIAWTNASSPLVSTAETKILSTREPSSTPSTRQEGGQSSGTAAPADRPWTVKLHTKVARTIAAYGGENSTKFRPLIAELIDALEVNPKQFPKKQGQLKQTRSADVSFADGVIWRLVFVLDETSRTVKVVALGPHDAAYADARRRI